MQDWKLVPLKSSPMASSWRCIGVVGGKIYYRSPNGKAVAKDQATGQWYRVVKA